MLPDDVHVVEGLEAVRRRPGLYLGQDAATVMVVVVMQSSADEAREGHASELSVHVHDSVVTVRDNGRGIPVAPHPRIGRPMLEIILTTLSACNCGCDEGAGHRREDGNEHGLGLGVVNAGSAWMRVETVRDGRLWRVETKQGAITAPLRDVGPVSMRGTAIRWTADQALLPMDGIDLARVRDVAADLRSEIEGLVVDVREADAEMWA